MSLSPTLQTPVDLHNYTTHLSRAADAVEAEATPMQASAGTAGSAPPAGIAPQFTVSRRPGLDMSLPLAPADPAGDINISPEEIGPAEVSSPLDVPAFLRRQS